ncbi:hypothetical protein VTJ04DRAFT_4941 [Mycothermus thermophilus]|uniref:uncharacterized protein n=1 Tax=Humicola insolens TaxID=85995 RepID=UPI0037430DB9
MQMLGCPTPRKPENKGEMLREVTETTLAEGASGSRYSRLNRLGGTTDGRMEDDAASNMPGGMGSGDPNRGSNEKKCMNNRRTALLKWDKPMLSAVAGARHGVSWDEYVLSAWVCTRPVGRKRKVEKEGISCA